MTIRRARAVQLSDLWAGCRAPGDGETWKIEGLRNPKHWHRVSNEGEHGQAQGRILAL